MIDQNKKNDVDETGYKKLVKEIKNHVDDINLSSLSLESYNMSMITKMKIALGEV